MPIKPRHWGDCVPQGWQGPCLGTYMSGKSSHNSQINCQTKLVQKAIHCAREKKLVDVKDGTQRLGADSGLVSRVHWDTTFSWALKNNKVPGCADLRAGEFRKSRHISPIIQMHMACLHERRKFRRLEPCKEGKGRKRECEVRQAIRDHHKNMRCHSKYDIKLSRFRFWVGKWHDVI